MTGGFLPLSQTSALWLVAEPETLRWRRSNSNLPSLGPTSLPGGRPDSRNFRRLVNRLHWRRRNVNVGFTASAAVHLTQDSVVNPSPVKVIATDLSQFIDP